MKRITFMASLALLAGCVTEAPPPPPPVLAFAPAAACAQSPSLAGATSLTPEEPAGRMERVIEVGPATACLSSATGGQVPYVVFALPTTGKVASVSAGAILEPLRVFAPAVSTLGADGAVIRTFAADDFSHRGSSVTVLFAPKAQEKFVVIAAEPARIGGEYMLVSADATITPTPSGLVKPEEIAAFRAPVARAYSYAGQVFARVYFKDPKLP